MTKRRQRRLRVGANYLRRQVRWRHGEGRAGQYTLRSFGCRKARVVGYWPPKAGA